MPEIMVYVAEFPFPQRDQPLLLPVDMCEWLPEDDLVFIVLDAMAALMFQPWAERADHRRCRT
jgi:hypothetical protein